MTLGTAWEAGNLGTKQGAKRLLFGQMYEDPEIEIAAFAGKGRVFCIASAGSTALRLAEEHDVVACDINPVQLAYAERRAKGGAIEIGDAERAMNFARALMPLVGWRRDLVREFLSMSDVGAQTTFWRERLDTRRFRAGFDLLMSRMVLRRVYAAAFLAFLPERFGEIVRRRLERGFAKFPNATNPYVSGLLLGEFSEPRRGAVARVEFVLGDAASYLESCAPGTFGGFTLSNILDGAGASYRERLLQAVRRAGKEDAVVVLRSFAEPAVGMVGNLAVSDRAMLWGVLDVRSVGTL